MSAVTIAPGHQLAPTAAASYRRAIAAGAPTGHIRSARRDPDEQEALFRRRYRPRDYEDGNGPYNDVRWWLGVRWVRVSAEGSVGIPGTSRHETGTALDLDEPARAWFRKYGRRHGWIADRVAGEPWHFEYDEDQDRYTKDGETMFVMRRTVGKITSYRLVTAARTVPISQSAAAALKSAGLEVVPLPSADYLKIYRALKKG